MPSLQNADSLQGGRPRYHEESSQGDHSSSHFPLEVLFFFFFSQVEHDMVRYEVELMLHLCLISKREHDTIIKTLTFRLDQFVMEGKIENQVDLFQVKPKCEDVEKENALVDQTLDETVYKSFSAEESIVTEKVAENESVAKADENLEIGDKSAEITSPVEKVLNKSFVEIPEVELVDTKESSTQKAHLDQVQDLSLVIDISEENHATDKTDNFDLLILTEEPEKIVDLNLGKCVGKQRGRSLEKRGKSAKLDMDARVDLAKIRTRSASAKENSPKKVSECAERRN